MLLLSNSPDFVDSLRTGVDLAGNLTVIGGAIGIVLVFFVLIRGA
jgi:hypothetical protein